MKKVITMVLVLLKKHPALYRFMRYELYGRLTALNRKRIFLKIYRNNLWGDTSSVSGPGSSLEATEETRVALPDLVATLGARSILDIPCGDLQWMRHVSLGNVEYLGADIVPPLIEQNQRQFGELGHFLCLDLLRDPLPTVDIIFCRDCLVHLSYREINLALKNIIRASPQYLVTTTFPDHKSNCDTVTPYWRALNLELSPFEFPPPLRLIKDFSAFQKNDKGKYLGVWRVRDLSGHV